MSLKNVIKDVGESIFNRTFGRLRGAGLGDLKIANARAKWGGRNDKKDWRVRLTIPTRASALYNSIMAGNDLLKPLAQSRGMFWPLTPSMVIQHSANYNALAQTHSNYPFQAYQNSQVDQMNIIGEFPVQNQQDAQHWVATINFLRTVTKMFFGSQQDLKGNPPPILHLNGYGDHMFTNVPVVVNTFNVELRSGIDYISTKQNTTGISPDLKKFVFPSIELLKNYGDGSITINEEELEKNKNNIVNTLKNYKIEISKIKANIGPTVTLYEIVPEAGVRISKIKNLEDDIALSLSALGIRIIAPIPAKVLLELKFQIKTQVLYQ